jgi:hypothetical protein
MGVNPSRGEVAAAQGRDLHRLLAGDRVPRQEARQFVGDGLAALDVQKVARPPIVQSSLRGSEERRKSAISIQSGSSAPSPIAPAGRSRRPARSRTATLRAPAVRLRRRCRRLRVRSPRRLGHARRGALGRRANRGRSPPSGRSPALARDRRSRSSRSEGATRGPATRRAITSTPVLQTSLVEFAREHARADATKLRAPDPAPLGSSALRR